MPSITPEQVQAWQSEWRADPQIFAPKLPELLLQSSDLDGLATEVGTRLLAAGKRVVTAESCTAGGIGAALTAIAGSSAWVEGGFITYSNTAKTKLLGVAEELIGLDGAVSQSVVEAMAQGARRRLPAECSVAVSGVAGPGGGTPQKPVGTVWFAWSGVTSTDSLTSQVLVFPGDRAAIRLATVCVALLGLLAVQSKG
jgi:nicotinamide-nucleotide amidase